MDQRCPEVAITSLHYDFPWAMKALAKWTTYCLVTDRVHEIDLDTSAYYAVTDREDLDYDEKLTRYRRLADDYFETERYVDPRVRRGTSPGAGSPPPQVSRSPHVSR